MFRLPAFLGVAVIVATPVARAADRAVAPPGRNVIARANAGAQAPRSTSIVGHAWAADNTPFKDAKLRLRNATTGKVEATTVADATGRFSFSNMAEGTYVIEVVTEAGKVLGVGHTFTIAPGETVATFVRLGAKVPWVAGFFFNTAAAASSVAASQGITALAPV